MRKATFGMDADEYRATLEAYHGGYWNGWAVVVTTADDLRDYIQRSGYGSDVKVTETDGVLSYGHVDDEEPWTWEAIQGTSLYALDGLCFEEIKGE